MIKIKTLIIIILITILLSCKKELVEEIEKPVITAYLDTIIQDWEGQEEFINEYKRITDIDLKIIQPPHQQYMDKLIVSFSEDGTPDICEILPEYLPFFVNQKYAIPLNDYISKAKYLGGFPKGFLDNYKTNSGDIYGFPARDGGGCVTYIRKDWLDNLNLDIPKTWEEFYNVLYQFTYNDPDGNGIDDTRGYTDVNSFSVDWYNRAIMLDARVEIYNINGKWIDGFTEKKMISALTRLKKVYDEGLTDPNITNNTTFTARTRFINGDVGVITYWANHWARNLRERTISASGDQVEIIPIPPISNGYYIKRVAPLLIITNTTKDPEYVFNNFIDRQYDGGLVQELFTYGVKGFHWDNIDGVTEFLVNKNDPYNAPYTKSFIPPVAVLNNWNQPMGIDNVIIPAIDTLNNNFMQDKLKLGGNYFSQYYLEIEQQLKPEIMSKIINNQITIEEGIEMYKKKSKELNIDNILNELNSL